VGATLFGRIIQPTFYNDVIFQEKYKVYVSFSVVVEYIDDEKKLYNCREPIVSIFFSKFIKLIIYTLNYP